MFAYLTILVTVLTVALAKYTGPTNQAGLKLIKAFEGFSPVATYNNAYGIRTIGYGHPCYLWDCIIVPVNWKYNIPLNQTTGEALLIDDLTSDYEPCVNNRITYSNLNANQYSALVSFAFNLGCGNLQSSSLLSKLNSGDIQGAANEFPKWVYSKGQIDPGLVSRRAAEQRLFCLGGACGENTSSQGTTTAGTNISALTHTEALRRLQAAGITVSSSGSCSDTKLRTCTSLDSVRENTIAGLVALKSASGCVINVTGGTETGHTSGTYSHWNGFKADISLNTCINNYVTTTFENIGQRRDGAAMYRDASGNIYAKEGNHWDILFH